ncbi:hypothetical protein RV11_GL000793 [Enterococcus phoeniculicola]|nr:hypothetical protein RV11_GL000793 [Enterococcus phoeniculicola]
MLNKNEVDYFVILNIKYELRIGGSYTIGALFFLPLPI